MKVLVFVVLLVIVFGFGFVFKIYVFGGGKGLVLKGVFEKLMFVVKLFFLFVVIKLLWVIILKVDKVLLIVVLDVFGLLVFRFFLCDFVFFGDVCLVFKEIVVDDFSRVLWCDGLLYSNRELYNLQFGCYEFVFDCWGMVCFDVLLG